MEWSVFIVYFCKKCLRTNLTVFQKLFAPSQTTYVSRQYTQHKTYLKCSKGLLALWDKKICSILR